VRTLDITRRAAVLIRPPRPNRAPVHESWQDPRPQGRRAIESHHRGEPDEHRTTGARGRRLHRHGELGLRGKISGPPATGSEMSWNVSVFRTLLQDDYGIATSVAQGFFQNIDDTRRERGVEAGLNGHSQGLVALCDLPAS
jgi:hypothetical protein